MKVYRIRIFMSILCILCIFYISLCMSMLVKSPEEKEIDSKFQIIKATSTYSNNEEVEFEIEGKRYRAYSDCKEAVGVDYEVVIDKADGEIKVIGYERIY